MNANVPVLPIAGATVLRGSFAALALVTRWLKELARARRHRREARALAGLDQHMLADIGVYPRRRPRRLFLALLGGPDRALCPSARASAAAIGGVRPPARHADHRERLPPPGHRPAGAPDDLTNQSQTADPSHRPPGPGSRENPLSRPDQAPAGPSGGRILLAHLPKRRQAR